MINIYSDTYKALVESFVGPKELTTISGSFSIQVPSDIPDIPFDGSKLVANKDKSLLLLCPSKFADGTDITIRSMKERIAGLGGTPRFYNQDWYLNEKFIDRPLETKWLLVSKSVLEESRAMPADEIIARYRLHSAVELTFAFFANYFVTGGEKLWDNDYVWCSDVDDKGDQIYVGRYTDASGLNADGFEIHRHLRIKKNYGVV